LEVIELINLINLVYTDSFTDSHQKDGVF